MSKCTDKICPIIYASEWMRNKCFGEDCAWFSKCYTPSIEVNDKPKVNPELEADSLKRLYENALKQIEELKAECKWTPCSERLPNEEGYFIVTVPIRDEAFVDMMFFHKGVFCEFDDENGDVEYDDVIAWMPLPKPHEEVER